MASPTKQDVIRALADLYTNRSKRDGFHYVRSILQRYGNGATNITELKPEFYPAVYMAAGGTITSDDPHGSLPRPSASFTSARIRSSLTIDLESRLAARAGKPRSKPTMHVDYGNPAGFGDQRDDVVVEYRQHGEKMS